MLAIAPAAGAAGAQSADVRRRSEPQEAGPTRDPPQVAPVETETGRPILPAPAAFDANALPPEQPPTSDASAADSAFDDAAANAGGRESPPPPVNEIPIARLEVVDVPTHLGAPVTAYDASEAPPKLVVYV